MRGLSTGACDCRCENSGCIWVVTTVPEEIAGEGVVAKVLVVEMVRRIDVPINDRRQNL